jgi:uncharacterized membrane protein
VQLGRVLRHLFAGEGAARRAFTPATLEAIEAAIGRHERRHDGEVRFVIEAGLPFSDLWRDVTSRDRALELFGRFGVWDTERNAGVLIYVLLADRHVEIIGDRGIHRQVGETAWETICGAMQRAFAQGDFRQGALIGIEAVSDLLATYFPPQADNPDELPNRPIVM